MPQGLPKFRGTVLQASTDAAESSSQSASHVPVSPASRREPGLPEDTGGQRPIRPKGRHQMVKDPVDRLIIRDEGHKLYLGLS